VNEKPKDIIVIIAGIVAVVGVIMPKFALLFFVGCLFLIVPVGVIRTVRNVGSKKPRQVKTANIVHSASNSIRFAPLGVIAAVGSIILPFIVSAVTNSHFDAAGFVFLLLPFLLSIGVVPFVMKNSYKLMDPAVFYTADTLHTFLTIGLYTSIIKSAANGPGEIILMAWFAPLIAPLTLAWSMSVCRLLRNQSL
jgi:hypothetical protein